MSTKSPDKESQEFNAAPIPQADDRFAESMLKKTTDNMLTGLLYLISLLPMRILYVLSDLFYLLVRHVFRYRYKVVKDNVDHAFPEKDEMEKQQLIDKFYHHFADLMMESIKLHSISRHEMEKRVKHEGLDLIDRYYREGKSIIVLAMHHNNWEWCSYLVTQIRHQSLMVYNPIRGNKAMEKFLLHSRERWGGKCIPVNQSARVTLGLHRRKIPAMLWLGADQTPPANSQFWTTFLNREAPFFSGPEKIAAKTNQAVLFQHISKTSRGHYIARYIPLIEKPSETDPKNILLTYINKMEEVIRQEPEYYLWSHRRWKHSRPKNIQLVERNR